MATAKKVIDNLIEFIEIKTEQIKLKIISRIAKMLSGIIAFSLLVFFTLFFVLFLSFALAQLINYWMDSIFWGYLVVSSFYLLVMVIVFILVKTRRLQRGIENFILRLEEAKHDQEADD
ncbi:MAG: phage holin family protein [Ekhidna sp.]|nr:phage holin family protein [Ekhidna sp.]